MKLLKFLGIQSSQTSLIVWFRIGTRGLVPSCGELKVCALFIDDAIGLTSLHNSLSKTNNF